MRKGQPRTNYHRYSEEETAFLADCLKTMNFPQATAAFNERFGTSIKAHTIEIYCRKVGLSSGKSSRPFSYTDEQLDFMRDAAKRCRSNGEFYEAFCDRFGNDRTEKSVIDAMHRCVGVKFGKPPEYSDEQDAWLTENGGKMDMPHLLEAFNNRFMASKTENALYGRMKHLKVDRSRAPISGKTRFTDEIVAFIGSLPTNMTYAEIARLVNKKFGTRTHRTAINDLCCKRLGFNRTGGNGQFKKGHIGPTLKEVGHESNLNGYISVKIDDKPIEGIHTYQNRKANWKPKHRHIYEQHHGPIPKGWIVVFLDGNNRNFDPNNLYALPRSIHARMCQNNWYTESREHTLAGIKYCELDRTIRTGGIT